MRFSRREFLWISAALGLDSVLPRMAYPKTSQHIKVNLPAYRLTLMDKENVHEFKVGIGRGCMGRDRTPISEGKVYSKRKEVIFRYDHDVPDLGEKKGDIIKWNYTFDKEGRQINHHVRYDEMRGLGMKFWLHGKEVDKYVIHSTTDDFTIGTPSSGGCLRVGIEDMLRLYSLVAPTVEEGTIKPVRIQTRYDLVEAKDNAIELHADIYHLGADYTRLIVKEMNKAGYRGRLDMGLISRRATEAQRQFRTAQTMILERLLSGYPNNYLSEGLRNRLHSCFEMGEFLA